MNYCFSERLYLAFFGNISFIGQNLIKQDEVTPNTPTESESDKISQHVSDKVRGAIVAFKQTNRHLSGGALLTTKHVIAPASYLVELEKPNFANVSVFAGIYFNPSGQEYKIAEIDFDRKSHRPHSDLMLDHFAIVTVSNCKYITRNSSFIQLKFRDLRLI